MAEVGIAGERKDDLEIVTDNLMTSGSSDAKDKLDLLTEGFALAAISVSAYFTAYCYQASYLKEFGIPALFVTVSIEQTFRALGAVAVGAWVLWVMSDVLGNFLRSFLPKTWFYWYLVISLLILFAVYRNTTWKDLLAISGVMLVSVFAILTISALQRRLLGGSTAIKKSDNVDVAQGAIGLIGPRAALFLLGLAVLPLLGSLAGSHSAFAQTDFLATDIGGRTYVLVARDGDQGILASACAVAEKSGRGSYVVRSIDNNEEVLFRHLHPTKANCGPLLP